MDRPVPTIVSFPATIGVSRIISIKAPKCEAKLGFNQPWNGDVPDCRIVSEGMSTDSGYEEGRSSQDCQSALDPATQEEIKRHSKLMEPIDEHRPSMTSLSESFPRLSTMDSEQKDEPLVIARSYNPELLITNLAHSLCNISNLSSSLTAYKCIWMIANHTVVPTVTQDGCYSNSASNPAALFDIWGGDLDDEAEWLQEIEYSRLRMSRKLNGKRVLERLSRHWKSRQQVILRFLMTSWSKDSEAKEPVRRLLQDTNLSDEEVADDLTDLANSIADSNWKLDIAGQKKLLQNSAAIVRGRIESGLVSEDCAVSDPVTEGWFCVMMAVWSKLRDLQSDEGDEAERFRRCVKEENVTVPGFFTW